MKNYILSEVYMVKKQRLIVLFTSDVMYKKYKRLVYTPKDLLAGFCQVKHSARFFILASLLTKEGNLYITTCKLAATEDCRVL